MKKLMTLLLGAFVLCGTGLFAQDPGQVIYSSSDEAVLIQAIEADGDGPNDIYLKNMACKRLAVIGTDAAVPTLSKMLANEALNFNARFALEAMTTEASADALISAASELSGSQQIGVIDSIAMRKLAAAVPALIGLLEKDPSPELRKAVYIALGYIATDDAVAALTAQLAGPVSETFAVNAALADSLFDAAESLAAAGNKEKALEIYDAVLAKTDFPMFLRKAAAYHGLLNLDGEAGERIKQKMTAEDCCCFEVGLKTLREFDNVAPICAAVNEVFAQMPANRQALVVFALRELKDDNLKKSYLPKLIDLLNSDDKELAVSAARALGNVGSVDPAAAADALAAFILNCPCEIGCGMAVDALVALPADADAVLAKIDEFPADNVVSGKALLSAIELRRVSDCGEMLVKVATTDGIDPGLRDSALAALSEIVTLEKLDLLVDALAGETDDAKVDWILRAACTRLPREDCAKKVSEMFDAADTEGQVKLLTLLKQIGGPTALAKVEAACYAPATTDKATEVLGQWNTPDDIDQLAEACLKLAKTAKGKKYQVRGIRSYIRIPRQFNMDAEKRFAMCKTAFETAQRPEDKALIFEIFKRVVEARSANAALEYTVFDEYKEAACESAVVIAEKVQGTNDELKAAMTKVVETTASDDLKARAQKVLERQ